MSPIVDIQRSLRTLGRIRTGIQVAGAGGKRRPSKLETFRLTSPSRSLIDAAAEVYGGTVRPWEDQWEVVTTTAVLDIIIPPGQPVTQWRELWSGGGCERRCDGVTEVLTLQPCLCPKDTAQRVALAKDGLACKDTTRLNVMLPALPDLGSWLLESKGYYAAVELAGAAEILAMASANGRLIPARLRLEQRTKKVPGQPTLKYAVPIIEFVDTRLSDLPLFDGIAGAPHRALRGPATIPALPATTLPATSDFRAPAPLERPGTEPTPEVAQDGVRGRPLLVAPSAHALCGATKDDVEGSCGLLHDHLADPRSPRLHRVLDDKGVVIGSWPA